MVPVPKTRLTVPTCGTQAGYPEEFWNCADIVIYEGTPLLSPSPPPVTSSPSMPLPSSPSPQPPASVVAPPAEYPDSSAPYVCQRILGQGFPYGFYADIHAGCSGFYRCESAGSWYFECPTGLLFNQQAGACDWPNNVPCSPSESFASV